MIEKNGLKSGGKIVGTYISTYISTYLKSFSLGPGDVLFITGGMGDKAHYRAYGVAEELAYHGFRCAVTMPDNPRLKSSADRFRIFVFHKVTYTEKIRDFIEEIKKQKKEIIFDTDDLDFDPQYLKFMDYYSKISAEERQEYEKGIGAEILNDPYVKIATTTTSYLAEKLREHGKKVFIVSNKISDKEWEIAAEIYEQNKLTAPSSEVAIGYYSGTPSHDKDFSTIADVLLRIMAKHEKVKLVLAGPLDANHRLDKFSARIEVLPRVPRDKYYSNVAKCDINLAPLEHDNPFCEAKSEIKFIEAGVLGIPTVAVKNRTFSEVIHDGTDGFLAGTKEEWVSKIEKLITDEDLRRTMGEKAHKKVLKDYTNKNSHGEEYYEYLRNMLKKQDTRDKTQTN